MNIPCYDNLWLFRKCYYIQLYSLSTIARADPANLRQHLLQVAAGRPIIIDATSDPAAPVDIIDILNSLHGVFSKSRRLQDTDSSDITVSSINSILETRRQPGLPTIS